MKGNGQETTHAISPFKHLLISFLGPQNPLLPAQKYRQNRHLLPRNAQS